MKKLVRMISHRVNQKLIFAVEADVVDTFMVEITSDDHLNIDVVVTVKYKLSTGMGMITSTDKDYIKMALDLMVQAAAPDNSITLLRKKICLMENIK